MARVGARFWIARIMVTWGLCSAAMMFVKGPGSFYLIRFLLGVAEAGFFPGMILYLTYWIPARERSKAGAWFLTSTALAQFIGNPLGMAIMKLNGVYGLTGWQWLFLLEGIPTVFIGFGVYMLLNDGPADAKWLNDEERRWLLACLKREHAAKGHTGEHGKLSHAFRDKNSLLLSLVYCMLMLGFYALQYWNTTLIKNVSHMEDGLELGAVCAIPFLAAAIGMVVIKWWADRSGEPAKWVSICSFMGAAGLGIVIVSYEKSLIPTVVGLSVAAVGIFGSLGPFWALPSRFLSGVAAAAGIALINSAGNLNGGFVGNNIMGHSKTVGLTVDAVALLISGLITMRMNMSTAKVVASQPALPMNAGATAH